jgi:low affinity Fe/Cu permease
MKAESRSLLVRIGDRISEGMSRLFAHPYMQVGVLLFCGAWFWFGIDEDLLTAALSVVAITLTQMVLNGQYAREQQAHRRDIAMHAKLDELIMATKRARDEMAGIENLEEIEIQQLKEQAKEAIDAQGERAGNAGEREAAKAAVELSAARAQATARAEKARSAA